MKYETVAFSSSILLVIALANLPYGYYTFLKIAVCGTALYGIVVAHKREPQMWLIALIGIAITYNPLIPIYLAREVWAPINIVSAIAVGISGFQLRRSHDDDNSVS